MKCCADRHRQHSAVIQHGGQTAKRYKISEHNLKKKSIILSVFIPDSFYIFLIFYIPLVWHTFSTSLDAIRSENHDKFSSAHVRKSDEIDYSSSSDNSQDRSRSKTKGLMMYISVWISTWKILFPIEACLPYNKLLPENCFLNVSCQEFVPLYCRLIL